MKNETDGRTEDVSVGIAEKFKALHISPKAIATQGPLKPDYKRLLQFVERELCYKTYETYRNDGTIANYELEAYFAHDTTTKTANTNQARKSPSVSMKLKKASG